jgi:membrane fusion protein (multidrug efflux system)
MLDRTQNLELLDEIADEAPEPEAPRKSGWRLSRRFLTRAAIGVAAIAAIVFALDFADEYLTVGRYLESTDDAYVKADATIISPKVSGYISQVLVGDNMPVKKGDVLARIDDRDFKAAFDQARADVGAAEATIRNIDAQIALQQPMIEQAQSNLASAEASLKFAGEEQARYQDLMKTGAGTIQRAQQTDSAFRERTAQLQGSRSALLAAQKKLEVLGTERNKAAAQLDRAQAVERQMALNLSYTTIVAPVDGTVGARSLRLGQYVQAGTQLMAIVPLNAVYVVANFKETQLTYVRNGQPVTLRVDSFPDVRLKGHVDSLSPASGLEFALLPPDNATGNFTKIVQRVPVKIVLDDHDLAGLLRPGMSVQPSVDTKATVLAARKTAEERKLASQDRVGRGG